MFDYIKGEIVELTPASVVIETGGIGYIVHISLNTYSALSGISNLHDLNSPRLCKLYIYESIREDAHQLFGFVEKRERELFLHLISVSGIGANTARMVLSSIATYELEGIIASGNANALKAVKGIGNKTAERIIIDLKDKIKVSGNSGASATPFGASSEAAKEAVAALTMLGFNLLASQKVVAKIEREHPAFTVEEIIKNALKAL